MVHYFAFLYECLHAIKDYDIDKSIADFDVEKFGFHLGKSVLVLDKLLVLLFDALLGSLFGS